VRGWQKSSSRRRAKSPKRYAPESSFRPNQLHTQYLIHQSLLVDTYAFFAPPAHGDAHSRINNIERIKDHLHNDHQKKTIYS
jgi:hypothetical protein